MDLTERGPWFYRAILAPPLPAFVYLLWSGRLQGYWKLFRTGSPNAELWTDATVTSTLWLAAIAPVTVTALVLGARHRTARLLNRSISVGFREIVMRARGTSPAGQPRDASFARAPDDRPLVAMALSVGVAVSVPLFFAAVGGLRTPLALGWLSGAGLLMGAVTYCQRRAVPHVRDEPGTWDLFRNFRLLNPARYDEPGRPFVRWQIGFAVAVPIWWLGGGAVVMWLQ